MSQRYFDQRKRSISVSLNLHLHQVVQRLQVSHTHTYTCAQANHKHTEPTLGFGILQLTPSNAERAVKAVLLVPGLSWSPASLRCVFLWLQQRVFSFCCCPLDLFHGGWFANPVWSDVCTCYWFLLGVVNNHSWYIALDAHRALFIKAERFNCALCSDRSERCGFVWKNLLNWRKFARSKLNLIFSAFCLKTKLRRRRRRAAARSRCNTAQFLMTSQWLPFQNVTDSGSGYLPDFVFQLRLNHKILLWLKFLQFDSYVLFPLGDQIKV